MIDPNILRRAVTLGGPKEAALYFDQVFPVDAARPILNAVGLPGGGGGPLDLHVPCNESAGWDTEVLESLINDKELIREYIKFTFLTFSLNAIFGLRHSPETLDAAANEFEEMGVQRIPGAALCVDLFRQVAAGTLAPADAFSKIQPLMHETLIKVGFENSSIWYADPEYKRRESEKADKVFSLALKGLDLVDVTKIGWDAIL